MFVRVLANLNHNPMTSLTVKAFETIPHWKLVEAARTLGYSEKVLRMALAAYRLARAIGMDGVFSRLVQAVRGMQLASINVLSMFEERNRSVKNN